MKLGIRTSRGDRELATRLAGTTALRIVFLSLFLTATAFFYLRGDLTSYPDTLRIVFFTIGAGFIFTAIYAARLRTGGPMVPLAVLQLVLDQLSWTAIVYVSGGATSGATSFYGLTCLVGAVLIGLRGAAIAALTGLLFYFTLCLAFVLRWLPPPPDQGAAAYALTLEEIAYPVLVNTLAVFVVTLLAGYLADRLRRTGGELEVVTKRANEAERLAALGRIAAGLAHEIRNPLGSISGSIEMLKESPHLSDDDKQLCDIVRTEASRLNGLVGDMLDFAKPRAPEPTIVDLTALAKEVAQLAARSDRGGAGDVSIVGRIPEEALYARCDSAQIRQVLWNLVRNGVQASGAGATVTVGVESKASEIELSVSDQGRGLSEETRARIFDAFYTTRSEGAGIGLAVVKRIIDDHEPFGAKLEVESSEKGARFCVTLPKSAPPTSS